MLTTDASSAPASAHGRTRRGRWQHHDAELRTDDAGQHRLCPPGEAGPFRPINRRMSRPRAAPKTSATRIATLRTMARPTYRGAMTTSTHHLASRPTGQVQTTDFGTDEVEVPPLQDGEFLLAVEYLSIDPTIRAGCRTTPICRRS